MENKSDLKAYWHTTAHILAQAVKRLFPEVKLGIGPAIENGFYYDFYRQSPFTPGDLQQVEKVMQQIIQENLPLQCQQVTKDKAREYLKEEPFKLELLKDIPEDTVTFYQQGEFLDLCQGPHLERTGQVKYFKLLTVAASYWKGDENRESMQRIYGISFPEKKELEDYLHFLQEAKERDHRTLGTKLDFFSIHPEYGSGLIFWHPKAALVRKIIEDFWREVHLKNGYQLVYTPHIADLVLWERSGHTCYYRENMFPPMELENGQKLQLRPMNCPFHIIIYKNSLRSYRELPIRWAELGTVYRLEKQGVLHGLLRVRGFTQDDAHIFCTPEQLEEEIAGLIKLVCFFLSSFGFRDYRIFLSTRPDRYVGSLENWERATAALQTALKNLGLNYEIDPGAGVFYGPKIDIKITDTLKREWQCSTIQVDFNIPERFQLSYVNPEGNQVQPIMIHRAILGSLERFFGILLEHYKGNLPLWLSPVQCRILTIADRHTNYAFSVRDRLKEKFRVEVDERNEKINKKIREAEEEKIPVMIIVGDKEVQENSVSVRFHGKHPGGAFTLEQLITLLSEKIELRE